MLYFIINENAGKGKGKKNWDVLLPILKKENISFLYDKTRYKGHAVQLIKQTQKIKKIDAVVCVGGDGTLQEIVQFIPYKSPISIGLIPSGTGNDFAKSNNIPLDPIKALRIILEKRNTMWLDLGVLRNDEKNKTSLFMNSIGLGFDAELIRFLEKSRLKKILHFLNLGKFSYVMAAARTFFLYKPKNYSCYIDGTYHRFRDVWFFVIANQPFYGGGIPISPCSKNNDETLEIIIISRKSKWKMLFSFFSIIKGNHIRHSYVFHDQFSSFSIVLPEKQPLQSDGEYLEIQQFSISSRPASCSLFIS